MRKALVVLVVAAVVLACGLVAVALINLREARSLAARSAEMRAVDQATSFARRIATERPWTRSSLEEALGDLLGEEVLYAGIAVGDGTEVVTAGPAPAFDRDLGARARALRGDGTPRFARRDLSVGGEDVLEFAFAAPSPGRRAGAAAVAGRLWRELVLGEEFAGLRRAGPPILRLGLRAAPFEAPLRRPKLVALFSVILAPLSIAAAIWAAFVGRRAVRMREDASRRQHLASLGELAATVAHEIRNPLGAIKGYAQLVGESAEPAAAQRAASTIREECERLERTVSQVLGYARDAEPRLETVDLRSVLDEELARYADQAARREVRIVRDYGDERVEARVDRDQFARAVGNLLDNAVGVSPKDGRVVVALRPSRRQIELAIGDEGPGVPAAEREAIFEPFVSRRTGGTGLGLAVVRRIAEAHGGSVVVGDRPGGGAEFVLRLPR
ncbi:MAG: hypothetical protein HY905_24305 [Deltaproteobacteria bacterium]|nr:hypothetical protein [Deltaproteobacteria bacterium]